MNKQSPQTVTWMSLRAALAVALLVPSFTQAQVPVDENGAPLAPIGAEVESIGELPADADLLTTTELQDLVGPVALYPDDLLAIVLPASTYPLEVVQAARFLEELKLDSSLQPDEAWDESITALLNYPEVIQMMDEEIDWTWRLGEAVIAQQNELIAAIESFRDRAYAAGNLKSDEYQTVNNDDGTIEIEPANEEIIYVPYYEPAEVVVYQTRPVYYYYPGAYPVYYYPYPSGYHFSSGYFWGVTTAYTIGWNSRYLHVHHPSYWGHPYYGRSYYGHYYRRPSINIYNSWYVNNRSYNARYRYRDGDYWRPRTRSGARPHEQRVRNRHYPSNNRDGSAHGENGNGPRVRDNGRMDLQLRERDDNRRDRGGRSSARNNTAVVANRQSRQTTRRQDDSNRRDVNRTQTANVNRTRIVNANRAEITQNRNRTTTNRNSNRSAGADIGNTTRRTEADTVLSRRQAGQRERTISSGRETSARARPTVRGATANPQRQNRGTVRSTPTTTTTRRAAPERASNQRQRTTSANRSRASTGTTIVGTTNRSSAIAAAPRQQPARASTRGTSDANASRSASSARSSNRRGQRKPR